LEFDNLFPSHLRGWCRKTNTTKELYHKNKTKNREKKERVTWEVLKNEKV
jgi:hypothetical protein